MVSGATGTRSPAVHAEDRTDGAAASRYRAPALDKGLDILELLAGEEAGLTQTEIARALGRTPNEIYRMLDRLQHRGYIARADGGERLQVTLKLFTLAHRHPPMRRLISAATPVMRDLARVTEQSCHLVVYDTGRGRVVAQVDAPGRWGYSVRVGHDVSLVHTGSGHVLLAFQTEARRREMLAEHEEVEGEVPMAPQEIATRTREVRARGYERTPSAQVAGVTNLSVPVLGPDGGALAALTIPHITRIDRRQAPSLDDALARLLEAGRRLSTPASPGPTPAQAIP